MTGNIIAISGISGSGKTFLKNAALKDFNDVEPLLTVTTRPKRKDEIDGIDNIYLTKTAFEEAERKNEIFFVNQLYHNNWYAYRESDLKKCRFGITLIAEVATDAVERLRCVCHNVQTIYILPKDINETKAILQNSGINKKELADRIAKINSEIAFFQKNQDLFDYIIVNDYSADVVKKFKGIVSTMI